MTSGQPIRPPSPRRRVTHRRHLVAGAVGLHLGATALWPLLVTGEASAGPQPLPTVPASASGSASPSTAPPTGPPASPPASAQSPTPRAGRGGAHHHAPTPSATAVVVQPSPTSTSPPSLIGL